MSLWEEKDHRFTLTDYEYDNTPLPSLIPPQQQQSVPGPSRLYSQKTPLSPSPDIIPPPHVKIPPPVLRAESSYSKNGGLRLHQPEERPNYTPSLLTTSPDHPLSPPIISPTSTTNGYDFGHLVSSPTSSEIRPLPSIPRSFSTQRSLTTSTSISNGQGDDYKGQSSDHMLANTRGFLSPISSRGLDRHSSTSGISAASIGSNVWNDRHQEAKEKEFTAPPPLIRGESHSKKPNWFRSFWPRSWYCRSLLLTVILETVINLTIEVSPFHLYIGP